MREHLPPSDADTAAAAVVVVVVVVIASYTTYNVCTLSYCIVSYHIADQCFSTFSLKWDPLQQF